MELILFFAVAAVCAILGDLYLCWQAKKYEAAEEESAQSELGDAGLETEAAAEATALAAESAEARSASAAMEARPGTTENQTNKDAAKIEKKAPLKPIGKNWSLTTMRLIAVIIAFPVAALLAYYSYHVAHGANTRELVWVLKLLIILELLVPIGLLDAKYMKIPNKVLCVGLGFFAAFFLADLLVLKQEFLPLLKATLLGLLLGGGLFLVTGLISRSGMGGGDIKLFALLGLMMTWYGVFNIIFFSMLLIVVYSLFLLATKKIKKDTRLPMGPFTTLAMILVILLGI